jgi:hypothetical protein
MSGLAERTWVAHGPVERAARCESFYESALMKKLRDGGSLVTVGVKAMARPGRGAA